MSDLADNSVMATELFLREALRKNESNSKHLDPVGHCYYCDETVRAGVLFCSPESGHDWHVEQRIRERAGKNRPLYKRV